MGTRDETTMGRLLAVSMTLLLMATATMGCLTQEVHQDLSDWYVAMTVERFNTNGQRAVNVTKLKFEVRFGDVHKDTWMVQESGGFYKGEENVFPIRIEARYDNGTSEEDFPILGSSNVLTGVLKFDDDKMSLRLDGDKDLITTDKSIDRYPHGYERTATITGIYGELVLYFNLNEPT